MKEDESFSETTLKNLKSHNSRGFNHFNKSDPHMRPQDRKIQISAVLSKEKIHLIILRQVYNLMRGK